MLKSLATSVFNRLFILAALMIVLNSYNQTSCRHEGSLIGQLQQAYDGLKQALQVLQ
jgi:hypothetical protein